MHPSPGILSLALAAASLVLAVEHGGAGYETRIVPRAIISTSTVGSDSSNASRFPPSLDPMAAAHGILGCMAFGFFFPAGAVLVRLLPDRYRIVAHVWWQPYSLVMALAAMGLGLYMAITTKALLEPHAIIGIVAAGGLVIQPALGSVHHRRFKRSRRRTTVSYIHIFWGMGLVTLGIVNGGLGLQLGGQDQGKIIIYAIIVALIWVGWMLVSVLELGRKRREDELVDEDEEKLATGGRDRGGGVLGSSRRGLNNENGSSDRSEPSLSTLTPSSASSARGRPGTASTGTGGRSWMSGPRLSTLMSSLSGRGLSSRGLPSSGGSGT